MCVIASWKYLFKTLHFLNVMSHCHVLYFGCPDISFWYFMPVPILCGLFFCYPFLIFECCHFLHIMVIVDYLIDSYFWICVSLWSIALSPLCCTCLIVHFSIDGGFVWVWPVLSLYLCIDISGLHSYLNLIMLIFILCGAIFGSMLWPYSLADVTSIL